MTINEIKIFADCARPVVVAGPCSAESEEQVMAVAEALVQRGVTLFRAGLWKPRTRPGCFEGVGAEGLPWLARVKERFALPVATEVATAEHVELALKAGVDVLWVGARTTTNPFAVQEIASALRGVDVPVLVKNPVNPDLELWLGAFERLNNSGVTRLAAVHRGFSLYGEKVFRNSPEWQIPLELKNRVPQLPVICDPSHISGKSELVMLVAQLALDLNLDGLMVEVHTNPSCALSDARQQITPVGLSAMLEGLVRRSSQNDVEEFVEQRAMIDSIDNEIISLLAKRMEVVEEIGRIKRKKGLTVFQPFRYKDSMERCEALCANHNLDAEAVKGIFEAIHSESVRRQLGIVNGNED